MAPEHAPFLEEGSPRPIEADPAVQEKNALEFHPARPLWRTRTLNALGVSVALMLLLLGAALGGSFQAARQWLLGTPTIEVTESLVKLFNDDNVEESCHDAQPGDACHKNIVWARSVGIHKRPDWYTPLTAASDLKSFQLRFHKQGDGDCGKPCGMTCEDASPGSKCGIAITWAMSDGIYDNPEWYKDLNPHSTYQEFQAVLHKEGRESCPKPCENKHESPSLFCFSLMMPTGYEPIMAEKQLQSGMGIFGCDAHAVYSNASFKIPAGDKVPLQIQTIPIGGSLEVPIGGRYQVLLNKQIFVRLWASVVGDGRPWYHDWTIKLDVDAVFLPGRLRGLLRDLMPPNGLAGNDGGDLVFLKNCKYTLYGAIEVVSRGALWAYKQHAETVCNQGAAAAAKVEDRYANECFKQLGARRVDAYTMLNDASCHAPHWPPGFPCNSEHATFHPFKSWEAYSNCYFQAVR